MPRLYDMAILGTTPAGLSGGYYLSTKGYDVVVSEGPGAPAEPAMSDWVGAEFFRNPKLPTGLLRNTRSTPFRRVAYLDSALERRVERSFRSPAGYFVHTKELIDHLRRAATSAGATIRSFRKPPRIELGEDEIALIGGKELRARVLLIAEGTPDQAMEILGLPTRTDPTVPLVVAGLDIPVTDSTAFKRLRGTLHVVEAPEQTELEMFFLTNKVLHLRVISTSAASGTRAAELSQMLKDLQQRDILPENLQLGRARGRLWYPPGGIALELETHVAKRSLLTGTAGGFADTITGHTLYPSVKSTLLGADVAMAAVKKKDVQERMMKYKDSWRKSLGNYLRPPNSPIQMLLPLLFVNRRIVPRVTRALLYGDDL